MTTRTRTLAFLGTGTMGLPMVRNLLAAGLDVRVWNRTRGKAEPLLDDGATVHDSPATAAEGAGTLVTMLFDLESVAAVAPDALDALGPDAVWLQMSTVGLAGAESLAALAAERGVGYVDAPVLGTKAPAEQGALTVLAAAAPELRERARPVFDAVGSRTVWVDAPSGGTRLKLVANTWVLALTEGVAEAIALAEGLGLDPQVFLDTIRGGPTDAGYAQLKGAAMIARAFEPSFALDTALKDAGLILEAAGAADVDLAMTEAVRRHLARAAEKGHGAEDMAATYYAHQQGSAT
jgi:3-hydroxyisobutyrate dehydrogenase